MSGVVGPCGQNVVAWSGMDQVIWDGEDRGGVDLMSGLDGVELDGCHSGQRCPLALHGTRCVGRPGCDWDRRDEFSRNFILLVLSSDLGSRRSWDPVNQLLMGLHRLPLTNWGHEGAFVSAEGGSGEVSGAGANGAARGGEVGIFGGGRRGSLLLLLGSGLLAGGLLTQTIRIYLGLAIGLFILTLPSTPAASRARKEATGSLGNSLDTHRRLRGRSGRWWGGSGARSDLALGRVCGVLWAQIRRPSWD